MPKVIVDFAKCDGDGTCVSVCPVSVIEIQKKQEFNNEPKAIPVNVDACIICRACETQCPKQAIKIEE